ncbi:MAG: hypothetical protein HFJ38_07155 [Bacilli bacterium]|nr:hypothetical protein [Bacilli bacterium]
MDKKEQNNKSKIIISVLGLVFLLVLVVGISYAAFSYAKKGTKLNTIRTAQISMSYNEGENGISIADALPMEDSVGMQLTGTGQVFDFTVNIDMPGKGTSGIGYEVTAEKQNGSTLEDNDVKLYLERSINNTSYIAVDDPSHYVPLDADDEFGAKAGEMVLDTHTTTTTQTFYYRLRMWVDQNYEASSESKSFTITVNVYGSDTAINSKNYNVAIQVNNVTSSSTSVNVGYNGTGNVSITPKEGYYLSDVSCTNGYTTNAVTGASAIDTQNITINNNGNTIKSVCTFIGSQITWDVCKNNKVVGACPAGMPVDYNIGGAVRHFYILKDKGETVDLISTSNIVEKTAWATSNSEMSANAAQAALASATNGWNPIPRIITREEAESVGCTMEKNSCPNWLVDAGSNHWTSTVATDNSSAAILIVNYLQGDFKSTPVTFGKNNGVRAVISISK